MDEFVLQIILFLLTFTFLAAALLIRKTRTRIEDKNVRNTANMLHVRNIIQGKTRKFRH